LTVPYVCNISNDVKQIVKNFVDVRFTISRKLDNVIKRGKDRLNDQQVITKVVYKINCNNCDKVYIGQTKRHLVTRIKEYRNNIKNPSGNFSVVTDHRLFNHNFDWDNPNILHTEKNKKKRKIAEMFFIKKFNNTINL